METARKRGRPRAFDPDAALNNATRVFMAKGYSAASLDELSAAAGINRPSLYAAFGDKQSLYLAAIDKFVAGLVDDMERRADDAMPLAEFLRAFYAVALDAYYETGEPFGCLVFSTAVAEARTHPEIGARVASVTAALEAFLERRIAASCAAPKQDGTLATSIAQLAVGYLMLLGTKARCGDARSAVDADADRTSILLARIARQRVSAVPETD